VLGALLGVGHEVLGVGGVLLGRGAAAAAVRVLARTTLAKSLPRKTSKVM